MKRIILFLLFSSIAFAQVSSRTTTFKLPQWTAGNKLSAGTASDSSQSNNGLNNGFYRLDVLLGRQVDGSGLFKTLYGSTGQNLDIKADASHNYRITLNDSLYGYYNWQTAGNLLVQGNTTVGGYITADSLLGNIYADTISTRTIYASDNIRSGNDLSITDDATIGNELTLGSDIQDGKINFYNITSGSSQHLTLSAGYIFGGNKSVEFENRSGIVALQTGNDSLQAPTVHAVLFNSEKVAGTTLNDTSALFSDWSSNTSTEYPIVRLKYLHKAGITSIVARYYAYIGGGGDNWEANLKVGSLTSSTTSGSNTSYGSMSTTTLTVSGLTANTLYTLTFNIGNNTLGTAHFKELVITAESN